jgi:hypothetical protein
LNDALASRENKLSHMPGGSTKKESGTSLNENPVWELGKI